MNNTFPDTQAELKEGQRLAQVGIWHWDARTDAMAGSEELLRIYGLDSGMPDFKDQRERCYPEEEWLRLDAALRRALEIGAGFELDLRALRRGTTIWITIRGE